MTQVGFGYAKNGLAGVTCLVAYGSSASVSLRACELLILLAQGHRVKAGLPEDWLSVSHGACVNFNKAKELSL